MKDTSTPPKQNGLLPQWSVLFLSGGVAGTVAKTSLAPLERVKILFQIRSKSYPYTGVINAVKSISTREGVPGLWKGNTATILRIFPYAAIQFLSFEKYKQLFAGQQIGPLQNLICGSLAGTTSVIFTYPLDLIRVQLAVSVEKNRYNGIWDAIATIYKREGIRGLYRGSVPTILGIAPYAGVNFAVFEFLKSYAPKNEKGEISIPIKLACGGLAGAMGQTVAYPLDVVRRQMQTAGFEGGHGFEHKSTWGALKTIFQHEGFRGLFTGLSINYMKVVPAVAISFTTYESMKKWLGSL